MKREFEMSSSLSFEEILNEILRLEHYGFNSQKRSETAHGSSLVCVSHLFLEKIRASKIVSNPLLPLSSPLRLIRRPLLSTDHPGGQSTTRRLRNCISMMIDDAKDLSGECQRTVRLLELLQRTHYELVQVNGQRRLMAPEVAGGERQRGKGAEVFLGRLPRDCYEDELMPVLEQVGRLLELRLMLDFSGSTRGYAFAMYETPRIAREACAHLDGYEIRPGHRIGVVKSMDNCRLFFGGVPKNKTKPEFMTELTKMLDDITDIYLYPSAHDRSLNRGFIFVEFKDHRAAAMARRKLIPGKVTLWDHEIAVDWADPEPDEPIDEDIMERVTTLFVRNLTLDISQQNVRGIFHRHTNVPILKLKKINHFAFIHYENRQAAQIVMDIMQKPDSIVEKQGWEISWAKPIGAKNFDRQQHIREAITNSQSISNLQTTETLRPKQAWNKKRCIKTEIASEDESVYLAQMKVLQNFVKERFDATCTFDCVPTPDASGYIGTVIIRKDQIILFDFQGKPMASKHKALSVACVKTYQYFTSTLPNSALQQFEQHCTQSEIGVNPVVSMPISWHLGITQN